MSTATVSPIDPDTGRDAQTEAWLDERQIPWVYEPAVPVDGIDEKGSRANQARLAPTDPDVVERYTADMARGDRFPPLLALRRPRRALLLLGGNHRHAAHLANEHTTVPVYVVDAEPEAATRLMYEDNRRHGLPPTDEERIAQAVHLINVGWSQQAAAECVGISDNKVSRARAVVAAEQRARDLHLDGFAGLGKTAKSRLAALRSDPVFAEATRLVLAAGLEVEAIYDLVTRLNKARSDDAAMKILGAETEALRDSIQAKAAGRSARKVTTPRHRMLTAISHFAGCDPGDVANSCANAEQAQSLGRQLVDIRKRCDATLKALQARW